MLSTKWQQSAMWLTSLLSCSVLKCWNFLPLLSVSSLELGCKQKKKLQPGLEKICALLSRFSPRWTLECPSPMCFSTTVPEPSSPSETRICMVLLWAPAWSQRSSLWAYLQCILFLCGSYSFFVVFRIGCKCSVINGMAGGRPTAVFSVCSSFQYITSGSHGQGCCSFAWCIKWSAVLFVCVCVCTAYNTKCSII